MSNPIQDVTVSEPMSGVPIPPRYQAKPLLPDMEIGQCVEVTLENGNTKLNSLVAKLISDSRFKGMKVTIRRGEKSVRVWRIA